VSNILKYNPIQGAPVLSTVAADVFRERTDGHVWTFNPYTGTKRDQADVASDPLGLLIVAPFSEIQASPATAASIEGFEADATKYKAACLKMAEDIDLTRKMLCAALTKLGGSMSVSHAEAQATDAMVLHTALSPITGFLDVSALAAGVSS
jgi:hypothetical protein